MGNQNLFSNWHTGCDCACSEAPAANGCGECARHSDECACTAVPEGCQKRSRPALPQQDGTHVYFDACDGSKSICVAGECQQEEAIGRTLDVTATLSSVCPGRRSALGFTLTEVDENGAEYPRGFQAITVPAHNGRCHQDVQTETVRFVLPEDLSLQPRRHFIVRTCHHYLDAGGVWNNSWGQ